MRRLFERVSTLHLSSKKMKYVLKRWLGWEEEHGDEGTMAAVKARAREYVDLKAGGGLGQDRAALAGVNAVGPAEEEEEDGEEADESDSDSEQG